MLRPSTKSEKSSPYRSARTRTTMLKVANYLVRAQMSFFEHGSSHLRPMVLQDVADAVEMHVSTISRVSNGKYIQTPHGVFELKYFFDSRVSNDEGEDVSARSVKEKITRMISDEDKSKPLSDKAIADTLGEEGLKIARRTIAQHHHLGLRWNWPDEWPHLFVHHCETGQFVRAGNASHCS